MSRTREELLEHLKTLKLEDKVSDDILADIDAMVDVEKQTGIKSKNKVDAEAKKLRESLKSATSYKTTLEALGFKDGETDIEEFTAELKEKLAGKGGGAPDTELAKQVKALTKRLDASEKEKTEAVAKATEMTQKQRTRTLTDQLSKALLNEKGQPRMFGQDLVVKDLVSSGRVKLTDDEKVVFVNGEETTDMETGIKQLATERKDLLINYQQGGGGTGGGAPVTGTTDHDKRTDGERLKALRAGQTTKFL